MFDNHKPFQRVQKQSFSFTPNRYEIWIDGEMVKNGKTNLPLDAKLVSINGEEKVQINMQDNNLVGELAKANIFDDFITSHDRLQLITIPNDTNASCIGLQTMQMTLGSTCGFKNFNPTRK